MTQPTTATSAIGTESVIDGVFTKLVPAPGFFALAYFDYQPGAFFPPAKGAGPVVFRVLQGTLQFNAQDIVTKTPAGSTEPWDVPPDRQFTVTTGDQLVVPGDVVHAVRTVGSEPARILGLAVFAAQPPQQFPDGVSFEPLTLGSAGELPAVPATATVRRTRLEPAGQLRLQAADGPRIVHAEAGQIRVVLDTGTAQFWQGKGPLNPPATLSAEPAQLSEGDGVLLQAGAAVTIDASDGGATLLDASVSGAETANEQLLRRCVQEVIDGENPDLAAQYFAEQYLNHERPGGGQLGLAGLTASLREAFTEFSGISTTIDEQLGEDDIVVSRWSRTARNIGPYRGLPATGATVSQSGMTVSRVSDGKIVEEWEAKDVAALLSQLGASEPVGPLDAGAPPGSKAVASTFVYDVWSGGDLALIDTIFATDFVNHSLLPGQLSGRDGIRQFVSRWHSAFPDVNVTADLLVAQGERVAVRWTSHGTHLGGLLGLPPSGHYITVSGITMLSVRDGQITESEQQWAVTSLLEQANSGPDAGDSAAEGS